jgi:hypothetical protein
MSTEPHLISPDNRTPTESVEMPKPTVAPMVLSLGLILLAAGVVFGTAFFIAGAVVLLGALGLWIANLLPGRGHFHEALADAGTRARPVIGVTGAVSQIGPGLPGYRLQLPEKVHPISAGVRGGIYGGLVMPIPALTYGLVSGHGLWYPVNLLAGMVLPQIGQMSDTDLSRFQLSYGIVAIVIHAVISVSLGLMYGVLLPMLPSIPKPMAWGGLLMPLLWTAVSFGLMGVVNPALKGGVDWPSFVLSQFIFGVVAACVVLGARRLPPLFAGILGGVVGGAVMPIPAVLWGLATGHGLWYPVNLLAAMVERGVGHRPMEELTLFHADWFVAAMILHVGLSLGFGVIYGLALSRLPVIPGPMCWGSLLMPMLWTAASFGMMGVVNPVLQRRVDWPWFIVSQFVFGFVASIAVVRSEAIAVPLAGTGPTAQPPAGPTPGGGN